MIFAHANGYSPESYVELHEYLSDDFDIYSIEFSPFNLIRELDSLSSWHMFKQELIEYIEAHCDEPVWCMGHSLGAVSALLASVQRPELFSHLVLIDPVFLPKSIYFWMQWLPISLRCKWIAPSKIANRRVDTFESYEEAFDYYRLKNVFKRISDRSLRAYIEFGFVSNGSKIKLRFPKEWESRIFATATNPWPLISKVQSPLLIFRGVESDVIQPKSWIQIKKKQPNAVFVEIPESGHLLPMEQAESIAKHVLKFKHNH